MTTTTATVWYYQCGHTYWAYSKDVLAAHLAESYDEFKRWGWPSEAIGNIHPINVDRIDEDDVYVGS